MSGATNKLLSSEPKQTQTHNLFDDGKSVAKPAILSTKRTTPPVSSGLFTAQDQNNSSIGGWEDDDLDLFPVADKVLYRTTCIDYIII